ncbi:MarR family winged helix-turn-helix transcriptional regulator [Streptococcus salivarius]
MDHFGRLLKQANNNMMRHFDQFAKQYDLTGNQMSIIDFITNHADQEIFQRDIEREFEIQRSTTTVLLQRMEKKGLIQRHTSSKDARQKAVVLTDKALSIASACQSYLRKEEEEFVQLFSAEERDIFFKILQYYRNF